MKISTLQSLPFQSISHDQDLKKQVFLKAGDVPNLTQFARTSMRPGQKVEPHTHSDMTEIFYIERGEGRFGINGKWHEVRAGTFLAVEPGEEHEVIATGDEELVMVYFGVV
ncbi:uncharacterized protein VTP21DRAFT_5977 [Calcarisporiella thermophila]|uniref:uncharacterized protein n=1 Tax=Calcarisporiella thermophila TaxID=911321 RepID=UPI003743203C